jgi:hypothetical protein
MAKDTFGTVVYDKHIWFNPSYLLHCGFEAAKEAAKASAKLPGDTVKAINESRATCLWALATNKLYGNELLVQMVNPKEEDTPDTRVLHSQKRQLSTKEVMWGHYLDVEVVTYGEYSDEPLDDFLKRTKLAMTKAYQADTIIVCYINKNIVHGKLWKDIHQDLQEVQSQLETFLIGKVHPTEPEYASALVHPKYDHVVQFNVLEEAKRKYKNNKGVQIINLPGDGIKIKIPDRGFNPFTTLLEVPPQPIPPTTKN